jgi:L-ascorbate metabolism protein UlaG (beta-lactamase superfamily)
MVSKKRYKNMDHHIGTSKSWKDFYHWQKERRMKRKDLSLSLPQQEVAELDFIWSNREKFSITWIGHSTFLIQMLGLNIITDPVWARIMGIQKRLTDPTISINDLPEIDVVLISHNHYDHLHIGSLRKLKGDPLHLVPEGICAKLKKKGFNKVEELPWGGQRQIGEAIFTFVPAQHWSRRTPLDANCSHWGGWIISHLQDLCRGKAKTVYFVGDSAYFSGFKKISNHYDVDYLLMPIGAYDPEWFMSPHHLTPEEAVQAFIDTGARCFIPMHYGTFDLGSDTAEEALNRLLGEWNSREIDINQCKILNVGETLCSEIVKKTTN